SIRVTNKSEFSMDRICATRHFNQMRILDVHEIGKAYVFQTQRPNDNDLIPDMKGFFFHFDVIQWIRQRIEEGKEVSLTTLGIWPIVNISKGIVTHHVPARRSIWSPVFNYEGLGKRRQFLWPLADIWWKPEKLDLDPSKAAKI